MNEIAMLATGYLVGLLSAYAVVKARTTPNEADHLAGVDYANPNDVKYYQVTVDGCIGETDNEAKAICKDPCWTDGVDDWFGPIVQLRHEDGGLRRVRLRDTHAPVHEYDLSKPWDVDRGDGHYTNGRCCPDGCPEPDKVLGVLVDHARRGVGGIAHDIEIFDDEVQHG